ncbi:hypothetical protein [Cyanobium sp. CH-040]|uniref:hypothetical protein n=1 Tax=Cyanobium sp. CH-040 TaxID=2823708 RepID=UPI0020CC3DBB|nr:hypothetical protein [Cyanobium sp. CH-040]MCP9927309.1 hypothetical protein [Cyanobium sp. CH-040]
MDRSGWRRPLLLFPLGLGLAALVACANAGVSGNGSAQANTRGATESTSPRLGEALSESNSDQKALGAHLRAKGAVFYGAWWCPACFQQKNLFGKQAGNALPYVECDSEDGRERCKAAGIRAFPTWKMEGKPTLEGVQSLDELKTWSGFPSRAGSVARP